MKIESYKLKVKSYLKKLVTRHLLSLRRVRWGGSLVTRRDGITLIELIMTTVLMVIVALVVANALSTGTEAFFTTDNRKEALDQTRVALDRMAKEIRNLRNSTSVTASSDSQLCFTDTEETIIDYSYSSSNIVRDTGNCAAGGGSTLSSSIATFSFAYIQANGTAESPVQFVSVTTKRIRITATSTVSDQSVTLQTEVWPRNL